MQQTTHAHIALAHLHIWIFGEGAGTYSARVLRDCLLSLAGKQDVKLSSLEILASQQRVWLSEVIFGLHYLKRDEILSAAGIVENSISW